MKAHHVIALALLAAFGASTSAVAKVHVGENIASGVFAVNYDKSALADAVGTLDFAGRNEPCGYELVSGQSKWLNRDPIGEEGGINLYGMVGNDLVNRWDLLGCSESQPDPPLTPANTVSIKVNGNLPEPRASSGTKGRANLALIHFMLGFDNEKKIVYVSKAKAEGSVWWYKAVTPELNKIRGWHEHRHEQDNFQLWELLFEYAEKFKQRCATVEEFKCNEKAFRILVSAFGLSETYLLNLRHSDQNDPWMIKEAIGNERANAAAAAQDAKSRLEAELKSFYGELRRCQQKHRGMPYTIEVMRDNDNWVQRHIESIQAIFNTKTQDTQFTFPGASPP